MASGRGSGAYLVFVGLLLLGAGMLAFPDSNLLGGLGPLGGICLAIGLIVLAVSELARLGRGRPPDDSAR